MLSENHLSLPDIAVFFCPRDSGTECVIVSARTEHCSSSMRLRLTEWSEANRDSAEEIEALNKVRF